MIKPQHTRNICLFHITFPPCAMFCIFDFVVFQTHLNIRPRLPGTRRRRRLRRTSTSTTVPDQFSHPPPPEGLCRMWPAPRRPSAISALTAQPTTVCISKNYVAFYPPLFKVRCQCLAAEVEHILNCYLKLGPPPPLLPLYFPRDVCSSRRARTAPQASPATSQLGPASSARQP